MLQFQFIHFPHAPNDFFHHLGEGSPKLRTKILRQVFGANRMTQAVFCQFLLGHFEEVSLSQLVLFFCLDLEMEMTCPKEDGTGAGAMSMTRLLQSPARMLKIRT